MEAAGIYDFFVEKNKMQLVAWATLDRKVKG